MSKRAPEIEPIWPYLAVPRQLHDGEKLWTTDGPWLIVDPVGKLEAIHL